MLLWVTGLNSLVAPGLQSRPLNLHRTTSCSYMGVLLLVRSHLSLVTITTMLNGLVITPVRRAREGLKRDKGTTMSPTMLKFIAAIAESVAAKDYSTFTDFVSENEEWVLDTFSVDVETCIEQVFKKIAWML